ncbi:unnamed protein product [Arctogadus glacialis]
MIDGPVVRQPPSAEFILQSGEEQPPSLSGSSSRQMYSGTGVAAGDARRSSPGRPLVGFLKGHVWWSQKTAWCQMLYWWTPSGRTYQKAFYEAL